MHTNYFKRRYLLYFLFIVVIIAVFLSGFFLLKSKDKSKDNSSTQLKNDLNVNPQNPTEQKALEACLTTAYRNFMDEWNSNCKKSGINNRQPNCNLTKALSDSLNQHWTDAKNKCYK